MSIVETPIPREERSSPSLLPARGGGGLRRLGLFGMEPIEDLLPANRLAGALGMRFHACGASKAFFEDVIGFPNPHSLMEGRWTISRRRPRRQVRLHRRRPLLVARDRALMGIRRNPAIKTVNQGRPLWSNKRTPQP
ncbi:MAG: hypothetical protein A2Z34_00670 [Planctomycetes bacterium RBG_16_59_8]|nr:MAG: hypothetical protein A2Z34_00670 [Planctomycetes bacterium RBG_16_59_8]